MNTPRKNLTDWIALALWAGLFFPLSDVKPPQPARMTADSADVVMQSLHRDDWLGKDKLDHVMVSAGLVAAQFYFFHTEQNWERQKSQQFAAASTLALGVAKEIYDGLIRRGTVSWKDLIADVVGLVFATAVFTQ